MLSDRVQLSSAEARVEQIKGGSVGVFDREMPRNWYGFGRNQKLPATFGEKFSDESWMPTLVT